MHPFTIESAKDPAAATKAHQKGPKKTKFIAGGTTLLDLAKLHVETPDHLIDLSGLSNTQIKRSDNLIRIGASATMAQVAADQELQKAVPVLTESLLLAASSQIRNMATIGGNLLQRVRCAYFRDGHSDCNKREPGSGCAAHKGEHRGHAILGVSQSCFAFHPSDLCVALASLDAGLVIRRPDGTSYQLPFLQLHRLPGDTPHLEHNLKAGELIEEIQIPVKASNRASTYQKARDRASYQFALSSCAAVLEMNGDTVTKAQLALGGVATKPWRATAAEQSLAGQKLTKESMQRCAELALQGAEPHEHNKYKVPLSKGIIFKALTVAAERSA